MPTDYDLRDVIRREQAAEQARALAALRPAEDTPPKVLDPIRQAIADKQAAAIRRFRGETEPELGADTEPSPPAVSVNAGAGAGDRPTPEPPDFDTNLRAAIFGRNLRP